MKLQATKHGSTTDAAHTVGSFFFIVLQPEATLMETMIAARTRGNI